MSRRSGQQVMTSPLTFWLSAEKHIVTMLAGVATAAQTLQDAIHYLTKISGLSIEEHLRLIEENAYYIWERADRPPFGAALDHWLESERAILARIREQIAQWSSEPIPRIAR